MRKFIDAEQINIKRLLEDESIYIIPKFQREYAWQDEHVETFMEDIIEHLKKNDKSPYFLGTIVLVTAQNIAEQWTVVDGQQRLSTTLILLSVIRDIFNKMQKTSDVTVISELIESEDEDGNKSIRLKMSVNNDQFFKDHVMKLGIPAEKIGATQRVPKRNKNLAIAYSTIFNILNSETKKMSDQEKTKFLIKFYNHFVKYLRSNSKHHRHT